MKILEQSKLFYKKGNSDKVYEIDLCEVGSNLYVVNFRYGKRGANLKDGTKTASPVSRMKAQAVFTALKTEKIKKGYKEENIDTPKEKEFPSSISSKEEAILQRLREAINKAKNPDADIKSVFKSEWKTGRVAWKVAEMKLESAIPLLIELIQNGNNLKEIEVYSILYALVKCQDKQVISIFESYINDKNRPNHIQKIATEGLLNIESEKQKTAANLVNSLPPIIQECLKNQSAKDIQTEIEQRIKERQSDFKFFETLYLLASVYPFLQKAILNTLSEIPLRPPFFKYIRSVYKLAELRKDVRILGILSYRFEKETALYRSVNISENEDTNHWRYDYKVRKYIPEINQQIKDVTKEVKSKNSRIGFSEQTKEHFQRRDVKRLRNYALQNEHKQANNEYVKLATSILLSYQKNDYESQYFGNSMYGGWDRNTRKYTHHFVIYPEHSSYLLLNLILNGNNEELKLVSNKWRKKETLTIVSDSWYAQPSLPNISLDISEYLEKFNEKTIKEHKVENRNELVSHKWDELPQAYIQLLLEAKLDIIHKFAYKNLKIHSEYENLIEKFDAKLLKKLLSSEFEIPAFFGVEISKDKLENNFDKELTLILLNSKIKEGRELARKIIENNSQHFIEDTNFTLFVSKLIFNQYSDIRKWANIFLQHSSSSISSKNEKWQIIVGKVISEMLHNESNYSTEIMKDAQNILTTNAKTVLENLSWNIVLELLEDKSVQNQVFASDILVIKSKLIEATDIPFSILNGFFESKSAEMRSNGMEVFADYPENALLEAHQLLGNMLVSPYQNLRDAAQKIVIKLVQNKVNQNSKEGKEFAESIVTKLILALRKKDPEEIKREEAEKLEKNNTENKSEIQSDGIGIHSLPKEVELSVHKEIAELLINHFDNYLQNITLKTTLNLLHGNYREGQFVGFHILKNHIIANTEKDQNQNKEEVSIRQIVALSAHELLEIRSWTVEYYQNNLPRIRYERDEALRILDAKWEDVREKAMAFFRENFTENDWDVDSLVSIADSVRPDVEAFGKELITKFFEEKDGEKYLTMLSQHPSNSMQLFATNYLERFATGNLRRLKEMEFYFRCVLMQVNKGRIAKNRVLEFLEKEALSSKEIAFWVVPLFNDLVATNAVQDKEKFIQILQKLKVKYENLKVALVFE